MRKRACLITVSAIAVVALAFWFAWPAPEPTYNGHTLTYWFDRFAKTYQVRGPLPGEAFRVIMPDQESSLAISNIGSQAVPALLGRLRHDCSPARQATFSFLARTPAKLQPKWLVEWASPKKAELEANAASAALPFIGANARRALPELNKMMNDAGSPAAAGRALYAVAHLGPDGLPLLLALLQNTNAPNRSTAAAAIGQLPALGTNAAIQTLMNCLEDPDPQVAAAAAFSTAWITPTPELVFPAVFRTALAATNEPARYYAIMALGFLHHHARPAIPYLQAARSDPDPIVKYAAGMSIDRIGPGAMTNAPPP
jgi:HEAT repeat protein